MYDVEAIAREPLLLDPLRRSVEHGDVPRFLRSAKIKLTARCNLKCVMCRFGRGLSLPELDEAAFSRVLDELAAAGCRKVHFSGGEVLARTDTERLVARATGLGMKVTLTSNLTLLTPERAKALMRGRPSSISTSLDGATQKTHDAVRGIAGSFKRTLRAMERLAVLRERRGLRTRIRVNFTMLRANYRDYPALVAVAAAAGATEVHPMPVDDSRDRTGFRLSRRLIDEYNQRIAPLVLEARRAAGFCTDASYVYPFGRGRALEKESAAGNYAGGYYQAHLCYAPYTHLFVAWDGKVYLCCMTNEKIEPLGDLSLESVGDVFRGERFQAMRRQMERERLPACHRCDMFLGENRVLDAALKRLPLASGQ